MKAKKLFPDITFKKLLNKQVDMMYPVGSIYMSVNDTSPTTLFGGTWEQIKDRFLLSAGDTYENGVTGGEAEHTLTVNEMPSHAHPVSYQNMYPIVENGTPNLLSYADERTALFDINDTTSSASMVASATGGSQAHNNMPPYLTVFVWKRIA